MNLEPSQRFSSYDFVATILWIGFVLAISFMEAPLRFQAEAITIPIALQVGRLVFHALNFCEFFFAVCILVCQRFNSPSLKSKWLFGFALVILVGQTLLLFLVLDPRTSAVIAEQNVEESFCHTIYIALEVIKLVSLAFLAHSQLRDFRSNINSSAA